MPLYDTEVAVLGGERDNGDAWAVRKNPDGNGIDLSYTVRCEGDESVQVFGNARLRDVNSVFGVDPSTYGTRETLPAELVHAIEALTLSQLVGVVETPRAITSSNLIVE